MALTSTTKGFWFRKTIGNDKDKPPIQEFILANGSVTTLGDAITLSGGYASVCTGNARPIGVCVGVVDKNGLPVWGYNSHADHDGTVAGDDTFTAAGDNQTDHMVKVQVLMARPMDLYYNVADSASCTQANVGAYYDMESTGDQIDISGGAQNPGVWQLVEINPDGDSVATKGLFRIAEPYWQTS